MEKRKKSYFHAEQKHPHYEVRDISWLTLLWMGALIIGGLVVIVIMLDSYFSLAKEQEVYELVLKPESTQLRELRAQEQQTLTSYDVIDKQKGVYRIPIDRAMQLVADESFQARQRQGQRSSN